MDEHTDSRDHLRLASSRRFALIDGSGDSDPTEEPLAYGTPRPALTSIAVKVDGDRLEATATLALNGRVLTGQSLGDTTDRTAIIASATLGAVSALLDTEATLETATITDINGRKVAIAVLQLESEDPPEVLVGSALIRGDAEDATARSVLSALNRRLSR